MNQPDPIASPLREANEDQRREPPLSTIADSYARCTECGAPLDLQQRYCVNCGTRRGDAANPASRYLALTTRRRLAAGGGRPPPAQGSWTRAAAVGFFALLPLAVAIGVLVGRSGADNAPVQVVGDPGATSDGTGASKNVSDEASKLLPSDFSLDKGYTVKLDLLPIKSTDAQAASKAESDAKAKGADQVGIINPGDFTTTPDQGQSNYILYSGEYKQKAQAQRVVGKLKKSFPSAEVIAVASTGSDANGLSGTAVAAHTSHGTIHKVAGLNPTKEQIQEGTDVVNRIAHETGRSFIQQQRGLPDVIPVGGDPNDAPPLPTGDGD